MENQFSKVMSKLTDKELIDILTIKRKDYQPLAIEAAEKEIAERKIDVVNFEEIKSELTNELTEKLQIERTILNKRTTNSIQAFSLIIDIIAIFLIILFLAYLLDCATPYVNEKAVNKLAYFVFILPYFLYFIILDLIFQKTLGKFLTKTKVVNLDGNKCTLAQIAGRTFFRIIPIFLTRPFMKKDYSLFTYLDSFTNTIIISEI
ncbi:RDD family protein [Pedobacter sp. SD-b]|uniref:RDD family protein n=1 Tax=Pedobacter segetis TaxID=2793069 RepID=A0ABS1BN18_9SPHI|nr:RDD family protein [Pedobacter segetis]MBK0384256.1 RDD family protein [Pedobacter segetis]